MFKFWEESSIHGIKYISDSKSNYFIRFFWLLSFILSIIGLFYYGNTAFIKFSIEPDVNLLVKSKSIRDIPFPAVTICSPEIGLNKFSSSDVKVEDYGFLRMLIDDDLSDDFKELNYLAAVTQACNPSHFANNFYEHQSNLNEELKLKNLSRNIVEILKDVSFDMKDVFTFCISYHGVKYFCDKVMRKVITDNGFCYTYNLLEYESIFNADVISDDFHSYKGDVFSRKIFELSSDASNWSLGNGYSGMNSQVPFRISKKHQFKVEMKFSLYGIYECDAMNRNYKFILHLPNEYPNPFHYYKYIESKGANRIFLTAEYYDSDSEMKKFSPENRRCYFEGERQLKFFKTYTQNQCNYECLANFTLERCGCVKFSMPRDKNTQVCSLSEVVCYEEAINDWYDLNVNDDECNCLIQCVDIQYNMSDDDTTFDSFAGLEILFDDFQIKSYENYVSYKLQNLIAEFGGLLGCKLFAKNYNPQNNSN